MCGLRRENEPRMDEVLHVRKFNQNFNLSANDFFICCFLHIYIIGVEKKNKKKSNNISMLELKFLTAATCLDLVDKYNV